MAASFIQCSAQSHQGDDSETLRLQGWRCEDPDSEPRVAVGAGSCLLGSESNVFQKSLTQTEEADGDVLLRQRWRSLWILGHAAQISFDGFDAVSLICRINLL